MGYAFAVFVFLPRINANEHELGLKNWTNGKPRRTRRARIYADFL